MEQTNWRPIKDYEGFYSVSNDGQIRRDKTTTRVKAGHIMKLTTTRDGYHQVGLQRPELKPRIFRVHRLVWEAFKGPIRKGHVINHVDGCKTNNSITNLDACTNAQNVKHAFEILKRPRGGSAKVTESQIVAIRVARAAGEHLKTMANAYGVTQACISSICTGKTWAHIGGPITPSRALSQTPQEVMARITPEMIENVRLTYANGGSPTTMAMELGVSKRTILNWVQGKTRQK